MAPTISAAPLLLLLLGSAASYLLPAPRGPAVRAHPRHSAAQLVAGAPIGSLEEQQSQAYEQQQSIESEETYKIMMRALLDTEESLEAQVSANYAMFDYRFLQLLEESQKAESDVEKLTRMQEVQAAVTGEMAKRMETAAGTLRDVLTAPTAVIMEGKMAGLARQGKIDTALMDLLEGNLHQAQQAGEAGKGAVQVISKLKLRVREELDKKLEPPVALLRLLMRMDDSDARKKLLKEKMAVKEKTSVLIVGNVNEGSTEEKDTKPEVSPQEIVAAITELKLRFGNVDENYDTGFVKKIETISDEAEAVALELAGGKVVSPQQQQDMMWEKNSVSVWDLEAVEEDAAQQGKVAVWSDEGQKSIAQEEDMRRAAIQKDMGGM